MDALPQLLSMYCIIFLFLIISEKDKLQLWPLHRIHKLFYSSVVAEISLTSSSGSASHIFVGGIFLLRTSEEADDTLNSKVAVCQTCT